MSVGTLHVLVVDDRPDSVLFLTEFLISRQHRVETAASAADALTAVLHRRTQGDGYHLVIADVNMPAMDGLALARELRKRREPVEIALCTAFLAMHPTLPQEARALACVDVIEKPAELGRLDQLLATVEDRRAKGVTSGIFYGARATVRTPLPEPVHEPHPMPRGDAPPAKIPSNALFLAPLPPAPGAPLPTPLPTPPLLKPPAPPAPAPTGPQYARTSTPAPVPPPATPPTTSTFRDSGGPSTVTGGTSTARIRRSVSGHSAAEPITARITKDAPARQVACAHCAKPFTVPARDVPFTIVCVACGKLNRIDPA